jgi:hypothetical protein
MDFTRSASARQRAAHYQERTDTLRRMAEAEPVEEIRNLLLSAAKPTDMMAKFPLPRTD